MDTALIEVIKKIPQQAQRQYGTSEQLRMLRAAAIKLGLYDADDHIKNFLGDK